MAFAPEWLPKMAVRSSIVDELRVVRDSAPKRFSRLNRLRSSQDFQQVFHKPEKISGRCFTFLIAKGSRTGPRLGISISKRKVKLAVSRNRIKRVVRESFRQQCLHLATVDIVVIAHQGIAEKTNQELKARLTKQWQQLIKAHPKE